MCYDPDARPPEPPLMRGKAHGQDLVLTTEDGNRFAAYLAQPDGEPSAQVLIYPDVRGLHGFYRSLALRFAEVGIRALAIDYFGRTVDHFERDDSFEYMPHVQQMQLSAFFGDAKAALNYLRRNGKPESLVQTYQHKDLPTFTLGFCMGGSLSLRSGAQNFDLAGVIAFYAGLARKLPWTDNTTLDEARHIHYPVLGLFGGADQGIPAGDVQMLKNELDDAGVEHEIVIYPGAPHSFFDRKQTEFADASADAWTRVLNFIHAHSGAPRAQKA